MCGMNAQEQLSRSLKRLISVLSTGKAVAYSYGGVELFRAEVHILECIGAREGITASDIVAELDLSKGAVSQTVAKLAAKHLVRKTPVSDNMKLHALHLTGAGKQVMAAHRAHESLLFERLAPLLDACGKKDVDLLVQIIDEVAAFAKR